MFEQVIKPESFLVGLSLTVSAQTRYTLSNFISENRTSNFYLKYLYTLITCDHHQLPSKYSDTCIKFYLWQSTESRNDMEQALQGIVQ